MTTEQFLSGNYTNEKVFTAACYRWCNNNFPKSRGILFHVPNESATGDAMRMQLASQGVVSGIPDFINWNPQFAIELKQEKGVVSDKQKRIHSLWSNHAPVYVCRTAKEFHDIIVKHYGNI